MPTSRYCVFSHGKESGPWGKKIIALAETARSEGYTVESIDYRGIDTVEGRIAKLVEGCKNLQGELVLVGSSLGGYVATAASSFLHARGVFLMAPALYLPGIPPLKRGLPDCPIAVVHGWRDEVIPCEHSMRFARDNRLALHLVESDHQLHSAIPFLRYLFQYFLVESRRAQYVA